MLALQLAAASLGLATAWGTLQGGSPESEIRELLQIPEVFTVDHIVPIGYGDARECDRATALAPARERAARRRPLETVVHWEHYEADKARTDEEVERFITVPLEIAMTGLPICSSVMPLARHRLRAPAILRPWVVVALRRGIAMLDSLYGLPYPVVIPAGYGRKKMRMRYISCFFGRNIL